MQSLGDAVTDLSEGPEYPEVRTSLPSLLQEKIMAAPGPFIPQSDIPKLNLTAGPRGFSKRFNDALAGLPSTEHHLHPREKGKPAPPWPDNLSTSAFAVVDLTDGVPSYGVNAQEHMEKHIFSTSKVIPMYAAFRLQER